MNKKSKLLLTLVASCLIGASLTACGGVSPSSSVSSQAASAIKLNYTNKNMIFGDTLDLIAIYSGADTMVWSSSDENVATVDNDGGVTAVGEGKATITVSAGSQSATCEVSVSFGDVVPSLVLSGIPSSLEASISLGSSLPIVGKVEFNGKLFDCEVEVTVADPSIVSLDNGALAAKKVGSTRVDVKGLWHNFDSTLMRKSISINVTDNISIYAGYLDNGTKKVTNKIELSLVSSWGGSSYMDSATLFAVATENKVSHDLSFQIEDSDIAILDGSTVRAKSNGTTYAYATYVSEGGVPYTTKIEISVSCPIDTYTNEVRYCVGDEFPVDTLFGEGARILSAYQNGKELEVKRGKIIKGIDAQGNDTLPVEVQTDKGGYVFTNMFAYTAALDEDNIVSTLALSTGKIVTGYYILEKDITTAVDFTSQSQSAYVKDAITNTYFAGTFDGQGHTIKAKVSKHGMFGGFGNGALIMNTHFDFTFASSNTVAVGLSSNNAVFVQKDWIVTIKNNKFTASNYLENSYMLMDYRFNHLVLKDNLAILPDVSSLPSYTSASQEKAALFHVDAVIFQGPYSAYSGDFVNNFVITDTFMPMANGVWMNDSKGVAQEWVCYAANDASILGDFGRETTDSTQFGYSIISPYGKSAKTEYFGHLGDGWFSGDKLAVLYSSRGDIVNGGIYRYDTAQDLINKGIESVGDWEVGQ